MGTRPIISALGPRCCSHGLPHPPRPSYHGICPTVLWATSEERSAALTRHDPQPSSTTTQPGYRRDQTFWTTRSGRAASMNTRPRRPNYARHRSLRPRPDPAPRYDSTLAADPRDTACLPSTRTPVTRHEASLRRLEINVAAGGGKVAPRSEKHGSDLQVPGNKKGTRKYVTFGDHRRVFAPDRPALLAPGKGTWRCPTSSSCRR